MLTLTIKLIETMVTNAPAVAVLVWVLYRSDQRIGRYHAATLELLRECLSRELGADNDTAYTE
jgi:hypothetical protein